MATITLHKNLDAFRSEWEFVRKLTLDLLNALTETDMVFTPGEGVGSFWKHFRHMGAVQECYMESLTTGKIQWDHNKRYHGGMSIQALASYLHTLDTELWNKLKDINWEGRINWGTNDRPSVYAHLMRMYSHEILHHGSWVVYMRLLGKPFPVSWEFWGV